MCVLFVCMHIFYHNCKAPICKHMRMSCAVFNNKRLHTCKYAPKFEPVRQNCKAWTSQTLIANFLISQCISTDVKKIGLYYTYFFRSVISADYMQSWNKQVYFVRYVVITITTKSIWNTTQNIHYIYIKLHFIQKCILVF